jgi:hypothetical protein
MNITNRLARLERANAEAAGPPSDSDRWQQLAAFFHRVAARLDREGDCKGADQYKGLANRTDEIAAAGGPEADLFLAKLRNIFGAQSIAQYLAALESQPLPAIDQCIVDLLAEGWEAVAVCQRRAGCTEEQIRNHRDRARIMAAVTPPPTRVEMEQLAADLRAAIAKHAAGALLGALLGASPAAG